MIEIVHPSYGSRIDVAAIPARLSYTVAGTKIDALLVDLDDEAHLTRPEVMDDVFVVGFPINIDNMPNRLPIYKHATVASEPGAYTDTPRFYIDGETKPGMSGALVVLRKSAATTFDGRQLSHTGPAVTLVGIYSGRDVQAPDEYEASLASCGRSASVFCRSSTMRSASRMLAGPRDPSADSPLAMSQPSDSTPRS